MEDARQGIEALFRQEYGRLLATLIRHARDFELAEEALSDALVLACERWPAEGVPSSPAAWLARVARNRLIDRLRRRRVAAEKLEEVRSRLENQEDGMVAPAEELPDDRLRLIFTCCHPALAHEARVALTLNTLCGLTVPQIARAFLVRDATLAQRLVRAKRKIKEAGIPYEVPGPALFHERLPAVLSVVYLVFNEGYVSRVGEELRREDLSSEALRLGRLLVELIPEEPEVRGLLALMLFQDSRREARATPEGELVLLEDQDRSRWDAAAIEEGEGLLREALGARRPGPFQLQAAIAALHAAAPRPEDTDWVEIVGLYDELLRFQPTAVVALNRAVAVAMARGPAVGLAEVEALAGDLEEYVYLHAARADLLRRLERGAEAAAAYRAALERAENEAERRFLRRRLREVEDPDAGA